MRVVALTEEEIARITGLLLDGEEPGDYALCREIIEGRRDAADGITTFAETKVVEHKVERGRS